MPEQLPQTDKDDDETPRDTLSTFERALLGGAGALSLTAGYVLEWFKGVDGAGVTLLFAGGLLFLLVGIVGAVPSSIKVGGNEILVRPRRVKEEQKMLERQLEALPPQAREAQALDAIVQADSPESELAAARAYRGVLDAMALEQNVGQRIRKLGVVPNAAETVGGAHKWFGDFGFDSRSGAKILVDVKTGTASAQQMLPRWIGALKGSPDGTVGIVVFGSDISRVRRSLQTFPARTAPATRRLVICSALDDSFEEAVRRALDDSWEPGPDCIFL